MAESGQEKTDVTMSGMATDSHCKGEDSPGTSESGQINHDSIDQNLDKLLQKNRSELLFELRKIEHGDRPVTGQGNKEALENFFQDHQETDENGVSTSNATEQHRPEAVVVEVQGLFEQRRVSSILQTNNFRRHLENIIRGSISTAVSRGSAALNLSTPPRSSTASSTSNTTAADLSNRSLSNHNQSQTSTSRAAPVTPQSAPVIPQSAPVIPQSAPRVSTRQAMPPLLERFQSELSGSQSSLSSFSTSDGSSAQGNQSAEAPVHETSRAPLTDWATVNQIGRENVIQEVTELLHRRLVSSTLDSEFSGRLEMLVQDHLASTNTDGQRVQEFIQTINPTQRIFRNDFSHLGIPNQQDGEFGENWDNLSVTSISAHAVPYTQTNMHLNREIQALKNQIRQMKDMMKLSFDLQMDIQRSIRQEVAAAMNQGAGEAATASIPASRPVNDTHCLICLDAHSDSVLYQCGHMCVCYSCGKNLISRGSNCPVCRAPIRDVIRAYKCNSE